MLADPEDRGSVRLALTADGQAVQRSLKQKIRRLPARAEAGLNDLEIQRLQAPIRRLRNKLK
jgi:DNA-binding MarR family transcriptional regulator